jgi:hypothetical protein
MSVPKIYQSPDGSDFAIEQPDGEFMELHEPGQHAHQAMSLLEVVPDTWVRLVPSARASSVEFDEEYGMRYVTVLDEPVHRTTSETSVNVDWSRDGNLVGVELLGPDGDMSESTLSLGRVFLAGETVPAGVSVIDYAGNVWRTRRDRVLHGWAIEIVLPSADALEQHIQRRHFVDQAMEEQR